jgi:hypothetical protein
MLHNALKKLRNTFLAPVLILVLEGLEIGGLNIRQTGCRRCEVHHIVFPIGPCSFCEDLASLEGGRDLPVLTLRDDALILVREYLFGKTSPASQDRALDAAGIARKEHP